MLEYGILSGGSGWLANIGTELSVLTASPYFWPALGLVAVGGVMLYRFLR